MVGNDPDRILLETVAPGAAGQVGRDVGVTNRLPEHPQHTGTTRRSERHDRQRRRVVARIAE